jgi:galactose mutarotase-like enzyme
VTVPPTGRQYELICGSQRALIVELGAGLREYDSGAGPLVDGYGIDESPSGGRGQLLLPWPNRIAAATYRFSGKEYRLPVNEPKTGSAIHGLTRETPWHLRDSSAAAVTLALDLPPQEGYPFPLQLTATYTLGSEGLTVVVTAVNNGATPCPYGAGAHPYVRLVAGGLIDDALLHIPADATLAADTRGIPTGTELPVDGTAFDFRTPRPIGSLTLDTAFTRLISDNDGITTIELTAADRSQGVAVWMDASHSYAMIYSGDTLPDVRRRRHSLAIEPMTCAPDAFNSGAGLVTLEPGDTHSATWGIAPL